MTGTEHFVWARARALEYIHLGEPEQARASLVSDLGKHEATAGVLHQDLLGLAYGELLLSGTRGVRDFITGLAGPREQEGGTTGA